MENSNSNLLSDSTGALVAPDPLRDGVDHINIYSRGATKLWHQEGSIMSNSDNQVLADTVTMERHQAAMGMTLYDNLGVPGLGIFGDQVQILLDTLADAKREFARLQYPGKAIAVYAVFTLDEEFRCGWNFQDEGIRAGDWVHYDHGAGVGQNKDALIVWVGRTKPVA